ncbi:MASE1 domain-containing protein [Dyella acidisoli]|uniref:MASE1 domain-containing protein n=1 Tax=Dyella acidisoli TaxID=1867834 RepID=UPI0024E0BB59|nr:MASE1 domain-containing protein [Dyella acidisoli]
MAVALGYGILAALFRQFSFAQWEINAGLRVTALLLAPYRYWPALIVGESGYYIGLSYVCSSTWGMAWALINVVPGMVYVAPLVYWVRKRWPPITRNATHINMGRLLACALLASVALDIRNLGSFSTMKNLPPGYVVNYYKLALDYFIGGYLGILTVTPLVLLAYQKMVGKSWPELQSKAGNSRLLFESICLGFPVMAFLLWIGFSAAPHTPTRQMAQVAMFLPVVWLAFRHGWQGASIGGSIASCAVMLLMPELRDPMTIQAEAVVAFAISTMLIMGARIASLDKHVERDRIDVHAALALAQRNVYLGEMQLRMTSQALEQIKNSVQAGFAMMLGRLRHLQPAVDDRGYQRHALVAQNQLRSLADSLYPLALRERGLPSALREGTLAQVLREAGLIYSCDFRGPVSKLSHTLRMTIYRVIWEAVADVCVKKDMGEIQVRVRVGERQGRRGALVVIRFRGLPAQLSSIHWDELLPRMVRATSGLGLRAVRDRAALFEGCTRTRSIHSGHQISILLFDPIVPGVAISPAGQWTEC